MISHDLNAPAGLDLGDAGSFLGIDSSGRGRSVRARAGSPRQRSGARRCASSVLERGPAFRLAHKSFPNGRPRRSPEGPERSGGGAQRLDGRGRPCAAGRRGPPGGHAPADTQPGDGRIDGGSEAARRRRASARGSRGRSPSADPNVRTLGRLAMTLNRCHCQLCAPEVFSPRQPLPCGLAGRSAGVIEVARALCCLWSAAVTGRLFPGVIRSPLSVVLAALSAMRRADWSCSCPCPLPIWSVRSSSRSLVSVDTCCSSRSIDSCA